MNKNRKWKFVTMAVVGFLLLSLNPEVRLLGLLVEAVGLEAIFITFQAQLVLAVGILYRRRLVPIFNLANGVLEKVDPLYFRPKLSLIRAYPKMVLHSVPFLIAAVHIVVAGTVLSHA